MTVFKYIAKLIRQEAGNPEIYFQPYVLFDFATIRNKSEVIYVEIAEPVEPIHYIKLTNQKMLNVNKMKTVVTDLMDAIIINQILARIAKRKQMKIMIRVGIHTQNAS